MSISFWKNFLWEEKKRGFDLMILILINVILCFAWNLKIEIFNE